MSAPSVPHRLEVKSLPRWAQVAYAARCARRVLPLFSKCWLNAPVLLVKSVGEAVTLAEHAAADAAHPGALAIVAAKAKAAADVARTAEKDARDANVASASAAAKAAADAAFAAYAAATIGPNAGTVFEAILAAASADIRPEALAPFRRDFDLLVEAARDDKWHDKTPVHWRLFDKLWPDGVPGGDPVFGAVPAPAPPAPAPPAPPRAKAEPPPPAAPKPDVAPDPKNAKAPEPAVPARVFKKGDWVETKADGSWALERRIGSGGFGEVWLARNPFTNECRAVKFCTHPDRGPDRARHEANVVGYVLEHMRQHPGELDNIVPLLDADFGGEYPWLMYEFVPGDTTLRHRIDDLAGRAVADRIALGVPLLRTIAAAVGRFHALERPIVHRDLKPANVLMHRQVPRITDFGIGGATVAQAIAEATSGQTSLPVDLPASLHRSGTLRYSSPQQLRGEPPDPRDDVYSLGVIAYQMLLGDAQAEPKSDARDNLEDLGVPKGLIRVVIRNTSADQVRRMGSAAELAAALV